MRGFFIIIITMTILNATNKPLYTFLILFFVLTLSLRSSAQESIFHDTIIQENTPDLPMQIVQPSTYNFNEQEMLIKLRDSLQLLTRQLRKNEERISELNTQLELKNKNLEEQLRIQKEKESLFLEKEAIYKEAINSTILDKVKLEGQIAARDSKLEGKEREITLLQKNITDKDTDLNTRSSEMKKVLSDKEKADRRIDSLRFNLAETEKNLIRTSEQLKFSELKIKECESRFSNATNKKKKVRVVQGFAVKNYRTPDFMLAPKDVDNPSVYVINNRNSSNIEFDYITGASFMVKDLSKPGASLTYDAGFFLGFGGNNLFKNFYIGPNVKLFDVVHLNIGANIAEYEVLKDGFKVGDALTAGSAIPTNKAWKINGYVGITFDLEVFTMIGKK